MSQLGRIRVETIKNTCQFIWNYKYYMCLNPKISHFHEIPKFPFSGKICSPENSENLFSREIPENRFSIIYRYRDLKIRNSGFGIIRESDISSVETQQQCIRAQKYFLFWKMENEIIWPLLNKQWIHIGFFSSSFLLLLLLKNA